MTQEELDRANALCVQQAITITLYTGTSNAVFASNLTSLHCFQDLEHFTPWYVTQKLGSRNQKFNANYGPGIYLTDSVVEAKGYGTTLIQFVCTNTPYANVAGKPGTEFRKTAQIKGGPQAVLSEPNLAALLLVAAGGINYYVLRTPTGVVPGNYA
jgi:hypothetical protein